MASPQPLPRSSKLRTKKGCVTCRSRRKKCDEVHPNCLTCERLGLKCHWPNLASLEDRRERGATNSRWSSVVTKRSTSEDLCSEKSLSSIDSYQPGAPDAEFISKNENAVTEISRPLEFPSSYRGILFSGQIFLQSDREVRLMTFYCESFLPANILPQAHANFSKLYIGEVQELKNSMLACSSMQLANRNENPPVEALNYYTRAVSGLRRRLDAGDVTGFEDWLLVATILLHCFETWRCDADDSAPTRFQHLFGAIQLLKLRCTNPAAASYHDLYVLMAESVSFHVSTLFASTSSSAILDVDSNLWEWMETLLKCPAYENDLPSANHPVLGTPWELNKLVFEISKLTSRIPLMANDMLEKERLDTELLSWEEREVSFEVDGNISSQDDPYIDVRQLYIICARILLLWIDAIGDKVRAYAFEKRIASQKTRAIRILRLMENKGEQSWNFLLRWPLLILGHTVESEVEKEVIKSSLERIWMKSSCGDVKRSLDKMQSLWKGGSPGARGLENVLLLNG